MELQYTLKEGQYIINKIFNIYNYSCSRKVFWSDWNRRAPKIEWANMDGTGREVFLQGPSVQLPNSLAIDWETDNLCFADAGTKNIECVDIHSRIIQTIAVNCTYPFGLAISDDHYYWTDWVS